MKLWISFVPFYNDFNFSPIRQTYRYELEDMKYYITTFIVQKADLYLLEYEKVRVQSIRTHTYTQYLHFHIEFEIDFEMNS